MEEAYVTQRDLQNFKEMCAIEHKRIDDENARQKQRLEVVEGYREEINNLAMSVTDLANSIKMNTKENDRLLLCINSIDARLVKIENQDGERWRSVVGYLITGVLGIIIGYLFKQVGII